MPFFPEGPRSVKPAYVRDELVDDDFGSDLRELLAHLRGVGGVDHHDPREPCQRQGLRVGKTGRTPPEEPAKADLVARPDGGFVVTRRNEVTREWSYKGTNMRRNK